MDIELRPASAPRDGCAPRRGRGCGAERQRLDQRRARDERWRFGMRANMQKNTGGVTSRRHARAGFPGDRQSNLLCSRLFGCPVLRVSWLIRLAQVAFFAALIFTFYSAVDSAGRGPAARAWDKAEHFIAFYALDGARRGGVPEAQSLRHRRIVVGIRRIHRVRAGTRRSCIGTAISGIGSPIPSPSSRRSPPCCWCGGAASSHRVRRTSTYRAGRPWR